MSISLYDAIRGHPNLLAYHRLGTTDLRESVHGTTLSPAYGTLISGLVANADDGAFRFSTDQHEFPWTFGAINTLTLMFWLKIPTLSASDTDHFIAGLPPRVTEPTDEPGAAIWYRRQFGVHSLAACSMGNDKSFHATSTITPSAATLYHIVMEKGIGASDGLKCWINNVSLGSTVSQSAAYTPDVSPVYWMGAASGLEMEFDEFAIFSSALSARERQAFYELGDGTLDLDSGDMGEQPPAFVVPRTRKLAHAGSVRRTSARTISTTTPQEATYNVTDEETGLEVDHTTGRITVPGGAPDALYLVNVNHGWSAAASKIYEEVRENGSTPIMGWTETPGSSEEAWHGYTTVWPLSAGDYVSLFTQQDAASRDSGLTESRLSVARLGPFADAGREKLGDQQAGSPPSEMYSPAMLYFRAYDTAAHGIQNSDERLSFDTERWDNGSDFASDVYTAPYDGTYLFGTHIRKTGVGSRLWRVSIRVNSTTSYGRLSYSDSLGDEMRVSLSTPMYLEAGDTVDVIARTSGGASPWAEVTGGSSADPSWHDFWGVYLGAGQFG